MIKLPLKSLYNWGHYTDSPILKIDNSRRIPFALCAYGNGSYSDIYLIDLIALKIIGPYYKKGTVEYLCFSGSGSFNGYKLVDGIKQFFEHSLHEFTLNLQGRYFVDNNWEKFTYEKILIVLLNKLYLYDHLDRICPHYCIGICDDLDTIINLKNKINKDIDELLEIHSNKCTWINDNKIN